LGYRAAERREARRVERAAPKDDALGAIDDERRRDPGLRERVGEVKVLVDQLLVREPSLARERRHGVSRLPHRHADDHRVSARARLRGEPLERVDLADAGLAPGGPQTDDAHASAEDRAEIGLAAVEPDDGGRRPGRRRLRRGGRRGVPS
jgi:hypothetical protein